MDDATMAERPVPSQVDSNTNTTPYNVDLAVESLNESGLKNISVKRRKTLTRSQLEKIVQQKIREVISKTGEIHELKKQLCELQLSKEDLKSTCSNLEKQIQELKEILTGITKADVTTQSDGLQVAMDTTLVSPPFTTPDRVSNCPEEENSLLKHIKSEPRWSPEITKEDLNGNLLEEEVVSIPSKVESRKSTKNKLKKHRLIDPCEVEAMPKKIQKLSNVKSRSNEEVLCHPSTASCNKFCIGDFVSISQRSEIGLIKCIRSDNEKTLCHVHWFLRSCDTILGDAGNSLEIFQSDHCDDIDSTEIKKVLNVTRLCYRDWPAKGMSTRKMKSLFYQKRYEQRYGRFQDIPICEEESRKFAAGKFVAENSLPIIHCMERSPQENSPDRKILGTCSNCRRKREVENEEIPIPLDQLRYDRKTKLYTINAVRWRNQIFSVGTSIFLTTGSLKLPSVYKNMNCIKQEEEQYDETLYPEKYRKNHAAEDDVAPAEPFDIGCIHELFSEKLDIESKCDVHIRVKKYYRPQNTLMPRDETLLQDLNLLYWSGEDCVVDFAKVEGKCFVAYEMNLDMNVEEWSAKGPYRFYFTKEYNSAKNKFIKPSQEATDIGKILNKDDVPVDWPNILKPLRMMDVFSGCGGLSEGLKQSGVAVCDWAIEKFEKPAKAFELNNRGTTVYRGDCQEVLEKMKKGDVKNLPKKGTVELLCGGPPCTELSDLWKKIYCKEGDYSSLENSQSLTVSFLSYVEYFRPRFVILENVRDFTSAGKSMLFIFSLSRLVKLGYQVTFGVVQCGKYGVPQSRRRAIILAAAPGEVLPMFPEPTHAFPLYSNPEFNVAGKKFTMDLKWVSSAPYRSITVYDAVSDLPEIENDSDIEEMLYKNAPLTQFQQMTRGADSCGDNLLTDHMCKIMSPLNLARISYIPRNPVGDWRDLPNIEVPLSDDTFTSKLVYTHPDWKYGTSSNGELRGVCSCATSKKAKCEKYKYKQMNTLIPWCLPHTGNRHGNWSGLFGRVHWNSYFRTVVTNPEPMGKQGRVLHPQQDRVFSVRECARTQGFPDSFKFYGGISDKYNQIGNAVTPPLAKAIGYEIRRSIEKKIGNPT